jgi:hypothetical protein
MLRLAIAGVNKACIMRETFDELMVEFRMCTNMTNKEIMDIVQAIPISYGATLDFYKMYARFPSANEVNAINKFGIIPPIFINGFPKPIQWVLPSNPGVKLNKEITPYED